MSRASDPAITVPSGVTATTLGTIPERMRGPGELHHGDQAVGGAEVDANDGRAVDRRQNQFAGWTFSSFSTSLTRFEI